MQPTTTTPNPAALPWYSFPATRPILDSVWKEATFRLRAAGVEHSPERLDHITPHHKLLECPTLLLSQCCGPDLFQEHASNVVPFAAPVISAYAVAPGNYFSYIITSKAANLRTPRVVINNCSSHSGNTAMKLWLAANDVVNYSTYESGSHYQSVREIRAGRADLAAVDGLSWQFLDTKNLRVLGSSEPVLAPPFITGRESTIPIEALTAALNKAFERYGEPLGITGVLPVTKCAYQSLAVC